MNTTPANGATPESHPLAKAALSRGGTFPIGRVGKGKGLLMKQALAVNHSDLPVVHIDPSSPTPYSELHSSTHTKEA